MKKKEGKERRGIPKHRDLGRHPPFQNHHVSCEMNCMSETKYSGENVISIMRKAYIATSNVDV